MAGKSLNKVQLIGHLGKDPELRFTTNGIAVTSFSVATNYRIQTPDSEEWVDKTEWHNIVMWRKLAELAGELLSKGRQVYLEGRMQTRSWEGEDGVKRYTTEVVAYEFILFGGRGDGHGSSDRAPHPGDKSNGGYGSAVTEDEHREPDGNEVF